MSTGTAPDAGSSIDPRLHHAARTDGISKRKADHLQICTDTKSHRVESGDAAFRSLRFLHRAFPDLDATKIDTSTEFLGSRVALPLFISCMTGGSEHGAKINRDLARAAQEARIPVGTGSIRILFRDDSYFEQFHLKEIAPDVPVIANLGAVQLREMEARKVGEMLKRLEVQALAVHLNAGQELLQPTGDRDFTGLFDSVARFCEESPVPIIVKETGFGMRPSEVARLLGSGVSYVDLAGAGGTNWLRVEAYRAGEEAVTAAGQFDDWGIPTAVLLLALRRRETGAPHFDPGARSGVSLSGRLLASGGVRSGMDVAKCIALGAELAGLALPFARAVRADGVSGVLELIEELEGGLRTVMTLTGCPTTGLLKRAPLQADAGIAHAAAELLAADALDSGESGR